MSGSLTHSPADVIRQLLIDLGLGTTPTDEGSWPIFVSNEPDAPDNAIAITDTAGKLDGRIQNDGELGIHHGFQVRIRAATRAAGYAKANALAVGMDELVAYDTVTVSSTTYIVHAITRTGDILFLGKEVDASKRFLFTINAVTALRQTS